MPELVITLMTKLAHYETDGKASKWYIMCYKQINSDYFGTMVLRELISLGSPVAKS
jgi:hypothetical protein